jgi:uncharacterized protein
VVLTEILLLLLLGCAGGFLFGMVGIGGNVMYVPMLAWLFAREGFHDVELSRAVIANSLLILVFTGASVMMAQIKAKHFFFRAVFWTAVSGVTAAVFVSFLIRLGHWYSKTAFDRVFVIMLLLTLFRFLVKSTKKERAPSTPETHFKKYQYLLVGLTTGSLTALSGLGGSIVMIPLFTELMGIPIKKAHSIATSVVPLMAISVSFFYAFGSPATTSPLPLGQVGYLNIYFVAPIILSAIFTAPIGVRAVHRVQPKTQTFIFAGVISVVLVKMLFFS